MTSWKPPRGSPKVIRSASLRTGRAASWNGARLSWAARVSGLKAFRLTVKRRVRTHSWPVWAWRNGGIVGAGAGDLHHGPLGPVDGGEAADLLEPVDDLFQDRGRPTGRACPTGRPGRRCASGGRPSPRGPGPRGRPGSRAALASAMTFLAAALGSNLGRSSCGPAARTPLRIAPVSEPLALAIASGGPAATIEPPSLAGLGADVDEPVGGLDDLQVVLDDDHRVAQVGQAVDDVQELADVVEVQAGGRLVEDVERPAGVGPGQLGGELDALGLAAGERGGGLAEREVAEADVVQGLHDLADLGDAGEQVQRGVDVHGQDVGDRLAPELHGEGLGREPGPVAGVAGDPDVGQEVHLDPLLAGPLARLAPAPGLVEAEPARGVAADLGLGQLGEQLADQVVGARVGDRRRGRRAARAGPGRR